MPPANTHMKIISQQKITNITRGRKRGRGKGRTLSYPTSWHIHCTFPKPQIETCPKNVHWVYVFLLPKRGSCITHRKEQTMMNTAYWAILQQTQRGRKKKFLLREKVSIAASSNWSQTDPLSLPAQFQAGRNMAAKKEEGWKIGEEEELLINGKFTLNKFKDRHACYPRTHSAKNQWVFKSSCCPFSASGRTICRKRQYILARSYYPSQQFLFSGLQHQFRFRTNMGLGHDLFYANYNLSLILPCSFFSGQSSTSSWTTQVALQSEFWILQSRKQFSLKNKIYGSCLLEWTSPNLCNSSKYQFHSSQNINLPRSPS